jgi:hypothetical protein
VAREEREQMFGAALHTLRDLVASFLAALESEARAAGQQQVAADQVCACVRLKLPLQRASVSAAHRAVLRAHRMVLGEPGNPASCCCAPCRWQVAPLTARCEEAERELAAARAEADAMSQQVRCGACMAAVTSDQLRTWPLWGTSAACCVAGPAGRVGCAMQWHRAAQRHLTHSQVAELVRAWSAAMDTARAECGAVAAEALEGALRTMRAEVTHLKVRG